MKCGLHFDYGFSWTILYTHKYMLQYVHKHMQGSFIVQILLKPESAVYF